MTAKKYTFSILLLLFSGQLYADEGSVVASMASCRHIVIESDEQFLTVRLQEGNSIPQIGRAVGGTLDGNRGLIRLRVLSTSEVIWVYSDKGWMTESEALKEFASRCS